MEVVLLDNDVVEGFLVPLGVLDEVVEVVDVGLVVLAVVVLEGLDGDGGAEAVFVVG